MKRQFFLLVSMFITLTVVTLASQKAIVIHIPVAHESYGRTDSPPDQFFGFELFHQIDIKKLKMEEDGRHLVFHFERIRKMKKGCRFCCTLCKFILVLIHLSIMAMIFTHLFH